MIPFDFSYNLPQAAWLLLVVIPLALFSFSLFYYRKRVLSHFADEKVQEKVILKRSPKIFWVKSFAASIAWVLLILSLMQPKGGGHYPEESLKITEEEAVRPLPQDVILLFDISASMGVSDSRNGLTRLEFGKEIVDQIVAKLQGDLVSLYGFTSQVTPLSPPTLDYLFVRLVNRNISINEGGRPGTNFFEALSFIRDKFLKNPSERFKTLIILSDGEDTTLESQNYEAIKKLLDLLGDTETSHLQVLTIGLGSKKGGEVPQVEYEGRKVKSSLQEGLLEKLAFRGDGKFYLADPYTSVDLAQEIVSKIATQKKKSLKQTHLPPGASKIVYHLYFQIPLGLALLLLAFLLFWPDRSKDV